MPGNGLFAVSGGRLSGGGQTAGEFPIVKRTSSFTLPDAGEGGAGTTRAGKEALGRDTLK